MQPLIDTLSFGTILNNVAFNTNQQATHSIRELLFLLLRQLRFSISMERFIIGKHHAIDTQKSGAQCGIQTRC